MRLDRMLNFKQHLEKLAGKVTSRVSLIRRLAGTNWEPLPKHYEPWYSLQLNCSLSGAEAHTRRRLTSQSTALCGPYLVVSSRHLVSAPCLSRDNPCRPKAESSHPRIDTESRERRLVHSARHHNEQSGSMQTQVPSTLQE